MPIIAVACTVVICAVALAFNAVNMRAKRAGIISSSVAISHLAASAGVIAITAFALSLAIPDQPADPLAGHLPPEWQHATAQPAHDDGIFSKAAVEQTEADQAALEAVSTGTAVQRFIHVHEGDALTLLPILEQHIERGGGHVAPAPEGVIIATVPASYQTCLEAVSGPELDWKLTTNYRQFAQDAVSGKHQCPEQPGTVQRTVQVFFTVEPIGLLNNHWDQIVGNVLLITAALLFTSAAVSIGYQNWRETAPKHAA